MDAEAPAADRRRIPLYLRVVGAVVLGALLGVVFGAKPYLFGLKNEHLGQLGVLVIKLLKALAVPLIFLSILDSFVKTRFTARQGARLIGICLFNVSVAMTIGLLIMNLLRPGDRWKGHLDGLLSALPAGGATAESLLAESHKGTLNLIDNIASYVPKSLVDPFSENNVIAVVLAALLAGASFRRVKDGMPEAERGDILAFEHVIEGAYKVLVQMLHWVVELIPFAVFGVVAQVVGRAGLGVFSVLWVFLATMLLGLAVHALGYYPLIAWIAGGKPPRVYLGKGADAILTGLSCNSSLATVPITLACLDRMGVSKRSARMAACVGTNLNNDGITLYEAMAALFLAQAVGFELGLGKQLTIVLQAIMAGAGVAGIPEAGLIVLPLVLGGAGLPEPLIAAALPLIMTVDWIIARCRSAVNVMSDMLVAILLDTDKEASGPDESAGDPDTLSPPPA
ncbi:MAG: dicarboxylate/amino acid:cation symporter [Byssovorax sp.]